MAEVVLKVYSHPSIHFADLVRGADLAWRMFERKRGPHVQRLWLDTWFRHCEAALFHAVEEGKVKEWTP